MNHRVGICVMLVWVAFAVPAWSQKANLPKPPVVPEKLDAQIVTHAPGVTLKLIAEHPALVTPIGIDVDSQGRLWVIASHTHFRPQDYPGPEHDEILVFQADGSQRRVFYNKTDATMHVKVAQDGWVYLAERDRILRVRDRDGDGIGDQEENLVTLDTVSDYPHNGLSGMAWHPDGGLVFSLGENFGKDWVLLGKDGRQVRGRGEGGVFWMTSDGRELRRMAQGFWNPFGLVVRKDGEIFAAENDPGSRPPCRLLQVVEGADYGFQWVYGSAPVHPFVAWNGELRGTLGMIHPCGEGPSAIVTLGGGVLIPSWSNHAIDYFPLERSGAGYRSRRVEVLSGSESFRPVAMAQASETTYFVTDWVFSSYELHQRGRLWKLEIDPQAEWFSKGAEPPNAEARLAQELRQGRSSLSESQCFDLARGRDPYLADAALTALAKLCHRWTPQSLQAMEPQNRLWAIVALRRVDLQQEKWVRAFWKDPDPSIRFELLRWIADGVLKGFRDDVQNLLADPTLDYQLFEAALATWNTLQDNPGAGVTDPEVLFARLSDPQTPATIKSFALRLMPPNHKKLDIAILKGLWDPNQDALATEIVRTLARMQTNDSWKWLLELATTSQPNASWKADAIAGLGMALTGSDKDPFVSAFWEWAKDEDANIRHEALRALRMVPKEEWTSQRMESIASRYPDSKAWVDAVLLPDAWKNGRPDPSDTQAWLDRLDRIPGKANVESGRRLFHHPKLGQCAQCHRHTGRGNVVGPDLTLVANQGDRLQLLRSLLEPNRDVAPQYFPTALVLDDGEVFTGILLRSSSVDVFRDNQGRERTFKKSQVIQRKELKTSLMPTGLIDSLTDEDLRDLLAFLSQR